MASRRGTTDQAAQTAASGTDTTNGNGGGGGGSVWTVLGDLIGAATDVTKSIFGKTDSGIVFVPQSGLDATLLKLAAVGIIALIAYKLIKGK